MEILKKVLPVALAASLGACELVRAPTPLEFTDGHVQVHSILLAGSDTARVLVTRTVPSAGVLQSKLEPLAGATVRLASGPDTLTLSGGASECTAGEPHRDATHLRAGCYAAAVPGGVRAGGRYALFVDPPGGGEIRGEAVVPADLVLRSPAAGAEVTAGAGGGPGSSGDPVVVRWGSVPPDRRVELTIAPGDSACVVVPGAETGFGSRTLAVTGRDSAVVRIARAWCGNNFGPQRIEAELVMTAFDSAYTAYARRVLEARAVPIDRAAVGITGAIGVFAGAAVERRPVVVVVK